MSFWELRSVISGIADEYRGWRKFKQATGKWPVCSVLAGIFSIPGLFVSTVYLFVKALETRRLPFIYMALFVIVICHAAVWYGLRRLACKVDVVRAKQSDATLTSSETLEGFIR
jgi:hypothetical protein